MGDRSGRGRRAVKLGVVVALVAGLVVGGFWYVPAGLRAAGIWVDGGSPTIGADVFSPPPTPPVPAGRGVVGVAEGVSATGAAKGSVLAAAINALPLEGIPQVGWVVTDTAGTTLAGRAASSSFMPASTMKLLTSVVALETLPADKRFNTTVVSPSAGRIVLVGGGDPLLATHDVTQGYPRPASLQQLARLTADELKKSEETSVTVGFDARMFTGPDWHQSWEPVFATHVTRVSALIADVGVDATTKTRTTTPALTAATSFAQLLAAEGITVNGAPAPTADSGPEIAHVESLPLHVLVQQAMLTSDNTVTETILRHAAIATGRPASFAGAVETSKATLTSLGLWQAGAVIDDGSGVSRASRVTPQMLAGAIRLALTTPKFAVLTDSLPVAGATGTLRDRFTVDGTSAARGWVRGKTGSVRDANTIAGYARTANGQLLVVAFMTNAVTNDWNSKVWIDRSLAIVAGCGCR